MTLSARDVQRLLQDPSSENRAVMAGKVAVTLDRELSENERKIAHDVIGLMARDAAVMVRAALADNLKYIKDVPHDVAMRLAKDVEEVALPMLESSSVFTDADLIEILGNASEQKQEAIATREIVSAQVAETLVSKGTEKSVAKLMANDGAKISDTAFAKTLDRFAGSELVKAPMVGRNKLPVTIAERLVTMVSDRLKDMLVQKHELPAGVAADLIMQSRERATANLFDGANENEVEKLVLQLYNNSRLTPSLVLRAACTGDIAFLEWALATLAGVTITNARMLLHDAGPLGYKSIYEKSGMPRQLSHAFKVAVDVARETRFDGEEGDRERYRNRMIQRILTQYEDLASEDVDYLLGKLGTLAAA